MGRKTEAGRLAADSQRLFSPSTWTQQSTAVVEEARATIDQLCMDIMNCAKAVSPPPAHLRYLTLTVAATERALFAYRRLHQSFASHASQNHGLRGQETRQALDTHQPAGIIVLLRFLKVILEDCRRCVWELHHSQTTSLFQFAYGHHVQSGMSFLISLVGWLSRRLLYRVTIGLWDRAGFTWRAGTLSRQSFRHWILSVKPFVLAPFLVLLLMRRLDQLNIVRHLRKSHIRLETWHLFWRLSMSALKFHMSSGHVNALDHGPKRPAGGKDRRQEPGLEPFALDNSGADRYGLRGDFGDSGHSRQMLENVPPAMSSCFWYDMTWRHRLLKRSIYTLYATVNFCHSVVGETAFWKAMPLAIASGAFYTLLGRGRAEETAAQLLANPQVGVIKAAWKYLSHPLSVWVTTVGLPILGFGRKLRVVRTIRVERLTNQPSFVNIVNMYRKFTVDPKLRITSGFLTSDAEFESLMRKFSPSLSPAGPASLGPLGPQEDLSRSASSTSSIHSEGFKLAGSRCRRVVVDRPPETSEIGGRRRDVLATRPRPRFVGRSSSGSVPALGQGDLKSPEGQGPWAYGREPDQESHTGPPDHVTVLLLSAVELAGLQPKPHMSVVGQWDPRLPSIETVVLYCHGGGWMCNFVASDVRYLAKWSQLTGFPIVSVDYALAPAAVYPVALAQCYHTWRWVQAGGLGLVPRRIVIVGDSVGGNLAVGIALRAIQEGIPPPSSLVLANPVLNMRLNASPSRVTFMMDPISPVNLMRKSRQIYVPRWADPHVDALLSPLTAATDAELAKMPPTSIMVGTIDPMLDESVEFAHRLALNGVRTRLKLFENLPSAFLGFDFLLPEAAYAIKLAAEWMKNDPPSDSPLDGHRELA